MKRLFLSSIILFSAHLFLSNPGNLDTSFNQSGQNGTIPGTAVVNLTTASTPSGTNSTINGVALQTDNNIVVAGFGTFPTQKQLAVARFLSDGTLDTTFNSPNGYNTLQIGTTESVANAITIDPTSGNIIVTGYAIVSGVSKAFVARYLPNGTFDTTFNTNGYVILSIASNSVGNGICIDPTNSNIIITGSYNSSTGVFIARILGTGGSAGTIDTTFANPAGYATLFNGITSSGFAVAIQPTSNKYIITGITTVGFEQQIFVARFTTTGLLDTVFTNPSTPYGTNGQGYTTTNISGGAQADALAMKGDGTVISVGLTFSYPSSPLPIILAQFTPQGHLDTDFNRTGIVLTQIIEDLPSNPSTSSRATGVSIDLTSGNIIVCGPTLFTSGAIYGFFARYNQNGSLDTTFTPQGYIMPIINNGFISNCLTLDPNGKAIAAGQTLLNSFQQMAIARIIGGLQQNQATPAITQYGYNAQFINEFLYQSFYTSVISDATARNATLDAINTIIATYSSDYAIQPDFNFVAYLYLIQTDLATTQASLVSLYPSCADEITTCFTFINERIYQLIQP